MGVPCPECGRSYDVTLFAFGRTIHCACGSRVGLERRLPLSRAGAEPRFIADAMLGKLARWLRLVGVDTAWEPHIPDERLVRRSLSEGRTILTRDRRLPHEWRVEGVYLVAAEGALRQLREVIGAFDLREGLRPLTRCSHCNVSLLDSTKKAVRGRVPSRVLATEREFRECPACGRVYWAGSHAVRIRRVVDDLVAGRGGHRPGP